MNGAFFQLAIIGPGGFEIVVVMLALLLMFGAKDAPRIFRKLNDLLNQMRNTADNFKREIMYADQEHDQSRDLGSTSIPEPDEPFLDMMDEDESDDEDPDVQKT